MEEDITTLEKAMTQIIALGEQDGKTANQRVRWILNKEKHAEKLQATIWQYFMTQRIKPVDAKTEGYDKYIAQLTLLHLLSVQAMKAKQSVDLTIITSMRATLHDFSHLYLGKEKK
jgi:nickel superoxide dismutase